MTTKEVSVLENEVTLMGKTFNVYGTVEEPLFRAKDVADWLDISNVSQMAQSVDEDEKGICNVYTLGGEPLNPPIKDTWMYQKNLKNTDVLGD